MLSREEVAQMEREELIEEREKNRNRKMYCKDLYVQIEELQKIVAFYQGEGLEHPVEKEYRKLARIIPSKRSEKNKERLVTLAKAVSKAVDCSNKAFQTELDRFVHMDTLPDDY